MELAAHSYEPHNAAMAPPPAKMDEPVVGSRGGA
jgi:hypothetical protein